MGPALSTCLPAGADAFRSDAATAGLGLLRNAPLVHNGGVTRRRILLIIIAALAGGSLALGLYDPAIEGPEAAALADRLARHYQVQAGMPSSEFAPREGRQWADGWEFRWRFKPCPDYASLRVWISRNGRRATYAEFPDCAPADGSAARPRLA